MARYKKRRSKMFVVSPDNAGKWREVETIYDTTNDMFGVRLIGESEVKGYLFLVPRCEIENAILYGAPTDNLHREEGG